MVEKTRRNGKILALLQYETKLKMTNIFTEEIVSKGKDGLREKATQM